MTKILLINESPLYFDGNDYYAFDPWILFPIKMAQYCKNLGHFVNLWAPIQPIKSLSQFTQQPFKLNTTAFGKIHTTIAYNSFISFYKLLPRHYRTWRQNAEKSVQEADCVIVRLPAPMLPLFGQLALKHKKPLILFIGGDIEAQSDRILGSRGLKKHLYKALVKFWVNQEIAWGQRAAKIFVYSDHLHQRHYNKMFPNKLSLIRTPHLSLSEFQHRTDTCQSSVIQLLRVSWFLPSKGLEYLFESVSLLRKRGYNVELTLVGKERNPDYKKQLLALANQLEICPFIRIEDWIPYDCLKELYFRSDIQIISSLAEGTPRVILEGASNGLPLVCTDVGGCSVILTEKEHALLVPPQNSEAIATAVQTLIDDQALRQTLIKNSYALAEKFCFEKLGQEITDMVLSLSNE